MFKLFEKYSKLHIVAKASIWFLICSFIQKGISFITTPVFARLLTKEQYGLYGVYISWLQILTIVTTFRLDYSVFNKGMSKYPEDRDGYASSMLGLTTIVTTVFLVVYLCFRSYINAFTELSTVVVLGMILELYVVPAVSFWSLRERYEFHYKNVVLVTILIAVFNALFGVIAVLVAEDKGTARVLSCVLAQLCVGTVIYIRVMTKGRKFVHIPYWKFAVLFNIPLIPHYFSSYIVDQSDKIMIQKLVGLSAAALYSIAYTIGGVVKIFTSSIANTLVPLHYRMLENQESYKLKRQIESIMLVIAGLIFLFACFGPEIVWILGGNKYIEAIYVVPPVSASVFFSFLYTLLANIEFFYNQNKFAMRISCVAAMVNLVLNFIFIPIFGYVAAAYTTLFSYIIYAVGHILYVNKVSKMEVGQRLFTNYFLILLGGIVTGCCALISLLYKSMLERYIMMFVIVCIMLLNIKRIIKLLK